METQVAKKKLRKEREALESKQLKKPAKVQKPAYSSSTNDYAFIVGNGKSRLVIDPAELKKYGTVYGCNAQYREYDPDYLVSVDVKMINEIVASGYHREHQVWTNPNRGINAKTGINYFSPHKGWSSGPTALWFSATNNHKSIFILGFDYQGNKGKLNNVYADTFNYKKSTDSATYFGNWLNQTEKVIKEFVNIKFYRVIPEGGFIPDKLTNHKNLEHIHYDSFTELFSSAIYSKK